VENVWHFTPIDPPISGDGFLGLHGYLLVGFPDLGFPFLSSHFGVSLIFSSILGGVLVGLELLFEAPLSVTNIPIIEVKLP